MDGKTRVCGLIANPVEHSMSPMMHNFFAQRTGVNLAYVPFKVEEDRVGDAVKGAYALNILGMNVTVPHKQRVMDFLSELDEDARAIGAVNTLVRTDEGYKGYNTDGAGFSRALAKAGIRIEGEHCLLMGAGGAAKAAAYVLAKGGAAKIHILNRNEARARELAGYINTLTGSGLAEALPLEGYRNLPVRKNGYLAVQSTSVGMHPHVEDVIIDNPRFYEMIHTGVDIVYTPARTRFMKMVEEAGGRAVNGLDMLIYQGVIAYELWNPQVKVDSAAIETAKQMIEDYLNIFDDVGIEITAIDISLNAIDKLIEDIIRLSQRNFVIAVINGNDIALYLFEEGKYVFSNRSRLFSERGSSSFTMEVSNILIKFKQFIKTADYNQNIERVYFCGLDDYEEKMLFEVVSDSVDIRAMRLANSNTIYYSGNSKEFLLHKYVYAIGSLCER